jgi:membrane protein required for colicin V production
LPFGGDFAYHSGMIIDIVVGLVVLSSALISFMRGFIREVLTIAGVVGGILAAVFLGPPMAPIVRDWFGAGEGENPEKLFDIIPMEIVADAVTYGVIFIAVVIVLSVLSHVVSGAAKAVGLGPVDRTLGVVFGVARALVLLGLVYLPFHLLMNENRKTDFFSDSKTHFFIEKISAVMADYLPESDDVKKDIKEEAADGFKQKLENSDILGGKKKDSKPAPVETKLDEEGYKEEQRERLDDLFNDAPYDAEPVTNE